MLPFPTAEHRQRLAAAIAAGDPVMTYAKSAADNPGSVDGDNGTWAWLLYEVTGDAAYARAAITRGLTYLTPEPTWGRNELRATTLQWIWMGDRLRPLISVSLIVAALSGVLGHVFARTLPPVVFPRLGFPEVEDVLTSGMVPVAAALLFVLAWLFSPRHGLVGTWLSQARLAVRIAGDDLLGLLYRMEERGLERTAPQAPAPAPQDPARAAA